MRNLVKYTEDDKIDTIRWLQGCIPILNEFDNSEYTESFKFLLPDYDNFYDRLLFTLSDVPIPDHLAQYFAPPRSVASNKETVMETFANRFINGLFIESRADLIRVMSKMNVEWPWQHFFSIISKWWFSQDPKVSPGVLGCIEAIFSLSTNGLNSDASELFQGMKDEQWLSRLTNEEPLAGRPHSMALVMALKLYEMRFPKPVDEDKAFYEFIGSVLANYKEIFMNVDDNIQMVESFTRLLLKYHLLGDIVPKLRYYGRGEIFLSRVSEVMRKQVLDYKYILPNLAVQVYEQAQESSTAYEIVFDGSVIRALIEQTDYLLQLNNLPYKEQLQPLYDKTFFFETVQNVPADKRILISELRQKCETGAIKT